MPARELPLRSWLIWLTAIACLPPLGLNVLVPLDYIDQDSGTPSYKSIPVRIRKSGT